MICSRTQVTATRGEGVYRLSGAKEVINNVDRADAVVLFARTGGDNSRRAHSLFLLERSQLMGTGVHLMPRLHSVGVRGCHISGIQFDGHEIPAVCRLGVEGAGLEYALRAFQITRTLLPGASLGAIATAHRLVMRFALSRRLYGMSMLALPLVRATLIESAAELWAADCLTTLFAACLHYAPSAMQVYGALGKYLIPTMMRDVLRQLSQTLGARFYLRGGHYGIFEKIVRDYAIISVGHAGSLLCQATVVPFLPRVLGRHGDGLFLMLSDPTQLPPFCAHALRLAMPTGDPLLDTLPQLVPLVDSGEVVPSTPFGAAYLAAVAALIAERERLACSLAARGSAAAGADVCRYGLMLLATSVLLRRFTDFTGSDNAADAFSLIALSGLFRKLNLDWTADSCMHAKIRASLGDLMLDRLATLSLDDANLV